MIVTARSGERVGGGQVFKLDEHSRPPSKRATALMLDDRGQLAEATGASIFFVFDREHHTPKPDCFLDGITCQAVIAKAPNEIGRARDLPEEMAKAYETGLRAGSFFDWRSDLDKVSNADLFRLKIAFMSDHKTVLEITGRRNSNVLNNGRSRRLDLV
jgi:hypothetical protein